MRNIIIFKGFVDLEKATHTLRLVFGDISQAVIEFDEIALEIVNPAIQRFSDIALDMGNHFAEPL